MYYDTTPLFWCPLRYPQVDFDNEVYTDYYRGMAKTPRKGVQLPMTIYQRLKKRAQKNRRTLSAEVDVLLGNK